MVFRVPEDAVNVDLPYDAMFHEEQKQGAVNGGFTGNIDAGEYKYYKKFFVPEEYRGGHVMLQFEGIYRNASVFVNQSKVGGSAYGYTDFTVEAGDYLKYGEDNEVLVAVKCGTRSSRWYSGAGIYKDVWMICALRHWKLTGRVRWCAWPRRYGTTACRHRRFRFL